MSNLSSAPLADSSPLPMEDSHITLVEVPSNPLTIPLVASSPQPLEGMSNDEESVPIVNVDKERQDDDHGRGRGRRCGRRHGVATPEPGSTRMESPNRYPGTLDLFLLFYVLLNFLFQKCHDPNPRPDPNGGSEPEPGLLRRFHLSYQNILLIHLVAEAVSGLGKPIIIYKFKAIR